MAPRIVQMLAPAPGPTTASLSVADLPKALGIDLRPGTRATVDPTQVDRLATLLRSQGRQTVAPVSWNDPLFWNAEASPSERSQYFAIGNAINFRFWRRTDGQLQAVGGRVQGDDFRGSMFMWRAMKRAIDNGAPLLDAHYLAALSVEDFRSIFRDDNGGPGLDVALTTRVANLRDLGRQLVRHWQGHFFNVVLASEHSLRAFAHLSRGFRAYDDPLCKLTMVNAILHTGSGLYQFNEPPLPGIDYELVKQLVRQGVVLVEPKLRRKLLEHRFLTKAESLELRRTAMAGLVQLAVAAEFRSDALDNLYWLNRTKCSESRPVCMQGEEIARQCPFSGACARHVELGRPLELTRYY